MPELVEQQRDEEQQRRDDRQSDIRTIRVARVLRRQHRRGERSDDQRGDDQPAPVDSDPNPRDTAQLEGRAHVVLPSSTRATATDDRPPGRSRASGGVHKLDLPCKDADPAASADIAAYGMDYAEKLRG